MHRNTLDLHIRHNYTKWTESVFRSYGLFPKRKDFGIGILVEVSVETEYPFNLNNSEYSGSYLWERV